MNTVREHYESLLAPIYVWMAGGLDAAFVAGAEDVEALVPGAGAAVDLGAGFGMHAVPLARGGYDVLAIDSSRQLLDVLRANGTGLPLVAVEADLLDFARYLEREAALIVCLGDTLTHLSELSQVERLFSDVARSLRRGGRLVLAFRDYSHPPTGDSRFIPVRSDGDTIHTCFLEELPEHVLVHDIVHERNPDRSTWRMKVGSYRKLRLPPASVESMLRKVGLEPTTEPGPRGMVKIVARRI